MNDDWKKKIDDEGEREVREQKQKEEQKKQSDPRIAELGNNFSCHVCGKRATEPVRGGRTKTQEFGDIYYYGTDPDNWSLPGDLLKCVKCKEWTCVEHIHKGICQKCAEKM